ncbi:MAG TPA: MotA/TolQ/ExbB proton channel family protein [Polyangia bacterium]|nr:MotA/TolQ/ExbB proton channel family protein [Polyangia bacterium]
MNLITALKSLFVGSGATWILWLLLGLAGVALAIAVERALYLRGRDADLGGLARALEARLEARDVAGARRVLAGSRSLAASVAAAGLRVAHLGPAAAERAMQGASAVERARLEARLAFLGTLGNNAPFVGLFGTVVGVVQAFDRLGVTGAGGAAGQAASQAVMAGISEALIATAVGIGVALPAVAAHNYFQRRISRLLDGTEAVNSVVLAYLLAEEPPPDGLVVADVASEPAAARLRGA